MANQNRVIWQEGLSIAPQHFQQQQRHIDYLIKATANPENQFNYGFSKLTIDTSLLSLGLIGIQEASGVMQDGTPFSIPYADCLPQPIAVKQLTNERSKDIYLALPIISDAMSEIDTAQNASTENSRYKKRVHPVKDLHTKGGNYLQLNLAQLMPKLVQGSDELSAYTVLPVCRIQAIHPDGSITLDEQFIATFSTVSASPLLARFMAETAHLVAEKAIKLAEKIGSPTQHGVTGIAEFLMLQLLNGVKPHYQHLVKCQQVHPETLYLLLAKTCSELMTFTTEHGVAKDITDYQHNDLTKTFKEIMLHTHQALSIVLTPRAVPISLTLCDGIYTGIIEDADLFETARFILAVRSELPQEHLTRIFAQQTKVASPLSIDKLVRVQLAGIPLLPLAQTPSQLPFHEGYLYFQLDKQSAEWDAVVAAQSIVFHVAGNFPALDLQFWAVRGK